MSEGPATARQGYRGYIASRPVGGIRVAQSLQNLAVRDYAARHGLTFLLSATEYRMPNCYMVLEQVLDAAPRLDGIICFSLFMLPSRRERRANIWHRILAAGCTLHGALEGIAVTDAADIRRVEDLLATAAMLGDGGGWATAGQDRLSNHVDRGLAKQLIPERGGGERA
jgi:sporadic carbohydrate cluster protein (TIGR04323 family)